MAEPSRNSTGTPAILLVMTSVTGVVDAVSYLALGHVFTANMTGNIVFLGFALGGAPGVSISGSLLALACFAIGAIVGGRMTAMLSPQDTRQKAIRGFVVETVLLLVAATVSIGFTAAYSNSRLRLQSVVAMTAIAMGLRNAVVRKLGVPDLTTTVLTLTITAFAADSVVAGGDNPRWQRRCAAIMAMLGGAAAGAFMLNHSIALPLYVCAVITVVCGFAWSHIESKRGQ
jgi:uncharacterized membrane protein YoaK (UPF0700 family)